jgi:hypothetical protein
MKVKVLNGGAGYYHDGDGIVWRGRGTTIMVMLIDGGGKAHIAMMKMLYGEGGVLPCW